MSPARLLHGWSVPGYTFRIGGDMEITIIGTGNMARGIATRALPVATP